MTRAADPSDLSQLSSTVQQTLALHGLHGQLHGGLGSVPAGQRVQAVLAEDGVGLLQVLFAQDSLLDLTRLNELTGRKLTAVPPPALRQLLARHRLQRLPALPLPGVPCLYDARQVNADSFRRLLDQAIGGPFTVPLASLRPNLDRPDEDTAQISQAVEAFTARRIRQRLEEALEIPPLPHTANRIVKLRVDPNASIDDVTDVVETDPALAAQVISWASSPYYGSLAKIRSVEDAIIRVLGFDLVINLALGLALGKTLSLPKDEPQQATPYWQQAIYTATVVDGLLRTMPRERRPEAGLAYLGGLLHNFGYLVLAQVFPPHFSLFCRHRDLNPHVHHSQIEQHLLGITREQIGAWTMHAWGMPDELYTALRFQNDPDYQGDHAACANLVCLAVRMLAARGIGNDPRQDIPASLFERLSIDPEKAEAAVEKVLGAEAALRNLAGQMQAPGLR